MKQYKSHKIVSAMEIAHIERQDHAFLTILVGTDETRVEIKDFEYLKKHNPQVGGFYVKYDDGYESFSPAKAFKSGYTEVKVPMGEAAIEKEIQDKGLTAPRLTPELIDRHILAEDYHVFPDSQLTVCCLTLQNGFNVVGESACASPENFNAEIGRKIAKEKAREKIWAFAGYALKQELHDQRMGVEKTQG